MSVAVIHLGDGASQPSPTTGSAGGEATPQWTDPAIEWPDDIEWPEDQPEHNRSQQVQAGYVQARSERPIQERPRARLGGGPVEQAAGRERQPRQTLRAPREYSTAYLGIDRPGAGFSGFSQLIHRIQERDNTFGVARAGQLNDVQVRRLVGAARTEAELEDIEQEYLRRDVQRARDGRQRRAIQMVRQGEADDARYELEVARGQSAEAQSARRMLELIAKRRTRLRDEADRLRAAEEARRAFAEAEEAAARAAADAENRRRAAELDLSNLRPSDEDAQRRGADRPRRGSRRTRGRNTPGA